MCKSNIDLSSVPGTYAILSNLVNLCIPLFVCVFVHLELCSWVGLGSKSGIKALGNVWTLFGGMDLDLKLGSWRSQAFQWIKIEFLLCWISSSIFGWRDQLKILLRVLIEGENPIFLIDHSLIVILASLVEFGVEMAEETSESTDSFIVKTIQNYHDIKIDVVKFDRTNNFRLWRCEVLDALNAQNLEDALELQERSEEMEEKI